MQLHNILPVLDPINADLAVAYANLWFYILTLKLGDEDSKLALLLTMFPALRGRKPELANWLVEKKLLLIDLPAVCTFLSHFAADASRVQCVRLVGDQKTSETRTGENVHPKVEILSIIWDHLLDSSRQSWFARQASQDLNSDDSIAALQEEKGFGGTGFAAKSIVNVISACDSLSNLNSFPGLQADQRVCGPNPRELIT